MPDLALPARWRRSRGDRRATVLVLGGLTLFVAAVYVVVVLGGGVLTGHTSSPSLGLSVLATVIVALGFGTVQGWLQRRASRAVHGGRPSPYDVLNRFSSTVGGPYSTDDVPTRMAAVLLEAGSIINRDEELKMDSDERRDIISSGVAAAVKEFCDPRWGILGPL